MIFSVWTTASLQVWWLVYSMFRMAYYVLNTVRYVFHFTFCFFYYSLQLSCNFFIFYSVNAVQLSTPIYLSKEFKIATNINLYITLEMEVGPIFVAFKKWLEFWEKVRIERNKVVIVR